MDIFSNAVIMLGTLGFLYLLLKPKRQPKSKEQKQKEIRFEYKKRLLAELDSIENIQLRQKKKIALLKGFAKELEFSLFFDEDEVKALIQELARH